MRYQYREGCETELDSECLRNNEYQRLLIKGARLITEFLKGGEIPYHRVLEACEWRDLVVARVGRR